MGADVSVFTPVAAEWALHARQAPGAQRRKRHKSEKLGEPKIGGLRP